MALSPALTTSFTPWLRWNLTPIFFMARWSSLPIVRSIVGMMAFWYSTTWTSVPRRA